MYFQLDLEAAFLPTICLSVSQEQRKYIFLKSEGISIFDVVFE